MDRRRFIKYTVGVAVALTGCSLSTEKKPDPCLPCNKVKKVKRVQNTQPVIDYILKHYAYMNPTFKLINSKSWDILVVSTYGGLRETRFLPGIMVSDGVVVEREKQIINQSMQMMDGGWFSEHVGGL